MRYLAINTAATETEVLLQDNDKHYYYRDSDFLKASEALLPAVDKLLSDASLTLNDMDFFSVVIGPGSFTGIRIGVSTARAFCYALDKPCILVNYLSLVAYNVIAASSNCKIAISDGSNGTVYAASYDNSLNMVSQPFVADINQINTFLQSNQPYALAADHAMSQVFLNATTVSKNHLALKWATERASLADEYVHYSKIEPLYIRVSQAERDLQ